MKRIAVLLLGVFTLSYFSFWWTGETYAEPEENGAGEVVFYIAPDDNDTDSDSVAPDGSDIGSDNNTDSGSESAPPAIPAETGDEIGHTGGGDTSAALEDEPEAINDGEENEDGEEDEAEGAVLYALPDVAVLYIAPDGNDADPGSESAPLASLAGARDKIRELKESSGLPNGGVTVYVRGGSYQVTETTFFDEWDSGTKESPVRYVAYPGETPIFTGGTYIDGSDFEAVADEATLSRLDPEVRGEVLCYNLFENGFSYEDLDYAKDFWQAGNLREYYADEYYENSFYVPRMQVFIDDDALYPARYPNKVEGTFAENPYNSFLMVEEVIETGADLVTEQPNGKQCLFRTNEKRINGWKNLEDIIIFGMTGAGPILSDVVADKIDTEAMTVSLRATPVLGVNVRGHYAFANVFEELDRPGEYYIDKNTGMLYLYRAKDMENAVVKISRFDGSFIINAQGASHLVFSGLTFELTRGSVFRIAGGEECSVEDCTLKNFGISGVVMGYDVYAIRDLAAAYGTENFESFISERSAADNGLRHRITGCTFLNTGHAAAEIKSGHSGYREPGGVVFENNTVKYSGLIGSTYRSGLLIDGCGITVKNNAFIFCLGQAIMGNIIDTDIVYNEFCDSPCDMAEDTGAMYLNFFGPNDGVKIRYNYFHDITSRGYFFFGAIRRGVAAHDNSEPFRDFSYNVVYNVPSACDNPMNHLAPATMIGNVLIDCDYVLSFPTEYMLYMYGGESGREIIETYNTFPAYYANGAYKSPLWREKYPERYEYYEYMLNEKKDMYPIITEVRDNLVVYLERAAIDPATELPEDEVVLVDAKYGRVENNHFIHTDPGFADLKNRDFQLSKETAAKYGVEWLDMSRIGAPGGLIKLDRLSDHYEDPLRGVAADKEISVVVTNSKIGNMVSIWREVTPGVWEWAADAPLNGEFAASFPVKPGGTYTAFYQGDAKYVPQFMGGFTGETPPDDALKFTVAPDHDRWDYFPFELKNGVEAEGLALYVSPDGSDTDSGGESAPFATLAGARDEIRALKASSGLPDGGVTVYVRGGTYPVTETTFFDEADSGTETSPIRYAAYPGETPVFNGGDYIDGSDFSEITDAAALDRLYPEARDKVLCYDLFANGFTYNDLDYAKEFWQAGNLLEHITDDGYYTVPRMQVFIDDDALYLARYPNKADGIFAENPYNQYLMIQEVIETGADPITEQPNGKQCVFKTYEKRIKNWKNLEDIVISGMTGAEADKGEVVADKIDTDAMTVTLRATPNYGVAEHRRYSFTNVFEELDTPGEYYIDKHTGMLYLYPTKDMESATVKISRFDGSFIINAQDASHLVFSGLTFELTKGSVFRITGGENCTVEDCTLKNFGINGVTLGDWVIPTRDIAYVYDAEDTEEFQLYLDDHTTAENGIGHKITGCAFLNTGHAAADIRSGNSGYREPGGAVFENNTVKHSGLIGSTYRSGLVLNGCGITVKNNSFLFCQGQAINGNIIDTEITYNEFCDSPCDMAEDTCTIYINYFCANDGVKIRNNYFHDVTNRGTHSIGFDFAFRAVTGYDNGEPFRDFSYNVVYNAPSVYHNPISHTTPGTTIGNVFIDCDYVLDYPDEYMRDVYAGESGRDILETLNTFPSYYTNGVYKSLLWREKYPERYEFYEYMLNEKEDMYPVMTEVRDNLTVYLEKRMSGRATELPDSATIPTDVKYGRVENNHFLYDDPGFASMQNYDFQLSQETAAEYGIEWLDMSKIGAPGGFAKLERLSDRYEDPLRGIVADKEISVEILSGKIYNMVSLWREVTPGVWVWAVDVPLNGEFTASFPVKPGGTYTAFYHGDANYPPQFMGGIAGTVGAAPPAGVPTFTVEPDHDRWDYFPFDLSEDVDDDSGGTPPSTVYVAGITLTGGAVITEKAGTLQLTANITPGSATDKSVTWSVVSGGEYAAVDDTGCVSAKANGKAVIRATARDGSNVYGEITITITGQTSGSGSSGGSSGGGGGGSATTETTSAESEPEEEIMEQEATPLEENPFISDHIQYLYGYEDGTVQADRVISRAEAAAIFFRLLADANKDAYVVSGLTDLESGAWYYQSVAYLNSQGIISGYPDGSFKPDGNITRAEYAAMVSRFDELAAGSGVAFYDVPNEHWAVNYINSTASKGWVSGFEDGSFRPENNVTRAQVVTIVNPMLGRGIAMEDIPDWAPKYTDLTTAHWAYSDIIEASCAHQYELNEVGSEIWIPAGQAGGETQPDETDGADSAA